MENAVGASVEMAALSRPFNLGMLYDCREDKLVPGITLWDLEDLDSDMRETGQPNSAFEIISSESISDKTSSLGVEASLKASFLSGLISVEGSAKYLKDTKTSKHQARVTLQYKTTTQFKELTMNHLGRGNMKHQYVFEKGLATHVVTAILYGAHAFFVFDKEVSDNENLQEIQGHLKVMIKKIPMLSIEGEGSLQMEDKDREKVSQFTCRFHGDFCLEQSPVTFEEAVKVYTDLPRLLGPNGEKAVPMKVWLLPLNALDSTAAKLVRQISVRVVQEAQNIMEDFDRFKIRCNDMLRSPDTQYFPQIIKKVKNCMAYCSEFELGFQRQLSKKLPAIRGGGEDEAELAEVLKKTASSPFNSNSLNQWLDCKEREVYSLVAITNLMQNIKVLASQSHLYKERSCIKNALVFVFTSLGSEEQFLSDLVNHLRDTSSQPQSLEPESEQWYSSKQLQKATTERARLFSDFAKANEDNKNIAFIAIGLTDENHKGSTIYLYEDGFQVSENFEPPSKPGPVTVNKVRHNSAILKLSPPTFGGKSVIGYRVEYSVKGQGEWNQQPHSEADAVTVTGLSANTEYNIKVTAVTAVGVGPAVEENFKTMPCSPPRNLRATATSRKISLHWDRPEEVGQNVQILNYILRYGRTQKKVQWEGKVTGCEEMVIFGLQPETSYTVRVLCDCGPNGKSRKSSKVIINTTAPTHPAENIKLSGEKISSETLEIYKLPLNGVINRPNFSYYEFGEERQKDNRTIMLFEMRSSGNGALINGMLNYIFGVKWNDSYRIQLANEDTKEPPMLTVYKINHQDGFNIDYSLTIIDCQSKRDEDFGQFEILTQELIQCFDIDKCVQHLHAACLVCENASEPSFPGWQLGNFINAFKWMHVTRAALLTAADAQEPAVLKRLDFMSRTENGEVLHFKFNTSALHAPKTLATQEFDERCWDMGNTGMKIFFQALEKVEPTSVNGFEKTVRETYLELC